MNLRSFLWDFDGTLFDSYPFLVGCLRRALDDLSICLSYEEVFARCKRSMGEAYLSIEHDYGAPHELSIRAERYMAEETLSSFLPFPGIPELLREISERGGRHFLVTHRDNSALRFLAHYGLLPLFCDCITSDDPFPRKPDPASILHLIKKHRLNPKQCVYIGDRRVDIEAGKAAGIATCELYSDGTLGADFICADAEALRYSLDIL